MRQFIKAIYYNIHEKLTFILSTNKITSRFYYFFFSKAFNREMYSVIQGKRKYISETKNFKNNKFLIVRNIHKIEKGLSMRNRRDLFALDFIKETYDSFILMSNEDSKILESQLNWAKDVLKEYFKVTGDHPLLNKLREDFKNFTFQDENESTSSYVASIPYRRDEGVKSTISFDSFFELTQQRRSVRWYENKKVNLKLVDNAILAALQSPSACNRQPFEFLVVQDPEVLKIVANLPMGTTGYADNIPLMIVVVGNLDAYFSERDRHVIYIDASLASMSLMLALETQGLSSCAINWPDIEKREKKIQKLFDLTDYQRVIMCMSVGYADKEGLIPYSCKRSLEETRKII